MKIAVLVHLYHIDMLEPIRSYLKNIDFEYDLYFSLTKNYPNSFLNNLKNTNKKTEIIFVENRGMDIGGFLQTYRKIPDDYDLILKIHTKIGFGDKKNPSKNVLKFGEEEALKKGNIWFNKLMKGVLGNKNLVNKIVDEFKNNQECGIIGGMRHNNYNVNRREINLILNKLNITLKFDETFFVGGTIFWVRNSILKKYLTPEVIDFILEKSPIGYVSEPSINHAMERIFGLLTYHDKKKLIIL